MHSIRFRVTAITILAMLTAILSVFYVSFSIIRAENDRISQEMLTLIAEDTQKSLEIYTEDIEQSVELVANIASADIDSMVLVRTGVAGAGAAQVRRTPEQAAELDAHLTEYCQRLQREFDTVANGTQGIVSYYYCINPDVSENVHGFFYSKIGRSGFDQREPIDARRLDPNDTEHTLWYYQPIQRGRPSWVGPFQANLLNNMWTTSYLVPIYKSSTLIGVLGMDIPMATLEAHVSSIRVYDTGFACLLDAEGKVFYHPEFEQGSLPDVPFDTELLKQNSSSNRLISYTLNGQERQFAFTTLSNGMKLAVVARADEVNAASVKLIQSIVPIAVVVVLLFSVVIFLTMRYLTRPLVRLTTASQQLANADYDVALDYQGSDEVGALTKAFKRMRDQLQAYIDDLNRRVNTDDLTGLANQRHFFDLAERELRRLGSQGEQATILYFNLIGMKHFNRKYGFDEGDRLICAVSGVLARRFGDQCVSRFGQDHFAAICGSDHMEERLGAFLGECERLNEGRSLPIFVGIYQDDIDEVGVSVACDRAKYACDSRKSSYLSGHRYFDAQMLRQTELMRHVVNHLDQAISEHWVQVYYQPIVRATTGRVCDEEALTRWVDPERGFLSPADFIPALEDAGLIFKVDLFVLEQVLDKIVCQRESGLEVVPHSINLSRSDFDSCDIVEEIVRRVDAAGVSRDLITIEITESIIGSDFDFMKQQVARFQELGFPVWMDDFGSGYSSLDCLQSIDFDLLKFDMSFLHKLDESEQTRIILRELMRMAIALGVDTICEGVETAGQMRFLQQIGCSKLQGYYFSRPVPLAESLARYEADNQVLREP